MNQTKDHATLEPGGAIVTHLLAHGCQQDYQKDQVIGFVGAEAKSMLCSSTECLTLGLKYFAARLPRRSGGNQFAISNKRP